ncbi:sensor domain-containing protein [Halobaculum sp. CBA1158]|uniref:sensor domain-containing protein n=1 Tax=Halobaculum sp. CBA1158 TaxID=2904243 RepID=UPI001F3DD661|nr:sensor domain-containing protein [Halobaculum sp. CBA1158]UIO98729.1 sensor domain-containing protein [Halobaculum sp. CBA1158]
MSRSASVRLRRGVRSFLASPLRPQTYLNLLYLSLAVPLGFAYFMLLAIGVPIGLGLAVVVVGIPLLVLVIAVSLGLATVERRLATFLLGVDMDRDTGRLDADSRRERIVAVATDRDTWTALVYLPSKLLLGVASFTVITTVVTTGASLLLVPLYYDQPGLYVGVVTDRPVELHPALYFGWNRLLVGYETVFRVEAWRVTTLGEALAVAAVGAFVVLAGLQLLNWLARLSGWYTRVMLGDTYDVIGATRRALDRGTRGA